MVNITYGLITGTSNDVDSAVIDKYGTDMIVAQDDATLASYDPGDIAFMILCSALVWLMIPGLGYLYSGLVRRKNALNLLFLCVTSLLVSQFTWWFWGYSLTFSDVDRPFFGDLRNFCFMGVLGRPVPETNDKIPEIVFALYQSLFCSLVPAIILGAACERARSGPLLLWTFAWVTITYTGIARSIWSAHGWAAKWGVLDYAGGGPIEINSGMSGLAMSYFLGHRRGYGTERTLYRPSNVSNVVLGTCLLWFGWLGFNGGSTFAANLKAALAIVNTNLAASVGGIVWLLLDWRLERKFSVVGACTGAIAGLVAITPAAGYVGTPAAALIGLVSSTVSNLSTRLKVSMRVDDPLDIFAVHALAGVVGLLMTGLFAQASVAANDGFLVIDGGWMDQHYIQFPKQLAFVAFCAAWSFVTTYLIMFIIDKIPGCHFRASPEAEIVGIDEMDHGEWLADYAWFRRDLDAFEEPASHIFTRDPEHHVEKIEATKSAHGDDSAGESTAAERSGSPLGDKTSSDPEKLEVRGRTERRRRSQSQMTTESIHPLERTESGRSRKIRGQEFDERIGRGRGQGGLSDYDHSVA